MLASKAVDLFCGARGNEARVKPNGKGKRKGAPLLMLTPHPSPWMWQIIKKAIFKLLTCVRKGRVAPGSSHSSIMFLTSEEVEDHTLTKFGNWTRRENYRRNWQRIQAVNSSLQSWWVFLSEMLETRDLDADKAPRWSSISPSKINRHLRRPVMQATSTKAKGTFTERRYEGKTEWWSISQWILNQADSATSAKLAQLPFTFTEILLTS